MSLFLYSIAMHKSALVCILKVKDFKFDHVWHFARLYSVPQTLRKCNIVHSHNPTSLRGFAAAIWTPSQYKDGLSKYVIFIIKIRLSWNRLIFIMGILYWQDIFLLRRPLLISKCNSLWDLRKSLTQMTSRNRRRHPDMFILSWIKHYCSTYRNDIMHANIMTAYDCCRCLIWNKMGQYHAWWWCGSCRRQVISRHDIVNLQ